MNRISKSNRTYSENILIPNNMSFDKPYVLATENIDITVWPEFIDTKLNNANNLFIWAYHVRIDNKGLETVQLISRHWKIIDENGNIQEISGEGVVGEKPVILPGDCYQYNSGVHLQYPSGIMGGHYQMKRQDGSLFSVEIPRFSLDVPNVGGIIN